MVDNLRGLRPGHILVADGRIFKIAKAGAVTRVSTAPDTVICDRVILRTVPPHFTGGALAVEHYGTVHVHQHVIGSSKAYSTWIDTRLDLRALAIGEGTPIRQGLPDEALERFKLTKKDLMAYVVKVHGSMFRDDIMRLVAALEGLPWIPTSNTEYFQAFTNDKSTLWCNEKRGNRKVWRLGVDGEERASRALEAVGRGSAEEVARW
jgi:hypothetical protein